ncbi:MAG: PAS domain S-box protein [Methanoregulaceae archaeon]
MKLREKTFLIVVIVLILVTSWVLLLSTTIFLKNYDTLEESYAASTVDRAIGAINGEIESMDRLVLDWAPWDETYRFVMGQEPDYVRTNLPRTTFRDQNIQVVIITDSNGQILFEDSYDPRTWTRVPLPAGLREQMVPDGKIIRNLTPASKTAGIIALSEGPMVVVSRPVLRSDFSGPPAGVLIMGRYLDENEIAQISYGSLPYFRLLPINNSDIPGNLRNTFQDATPLPSVYTTPLNQSVLAAFAPIPDVNGNVAYLLRLEMPRDIHTQGTTTVFTYILIQLGIGLFIGILIIFLISQFVLSRLEDPVRTVNEIELSGDLSKRIGVTGNDEISDLLLSMNHMLDRIESVQGDLRRNEIRFRELAELLPEIVFEMTVDGRVTFANRKGLEKTGYSEAEITQGLDGLVLLIPEDRKRAHGQMLRLTNGERSSGTTYTAIRKDGTTFPVIIFTAPIVHDGIVTGFRGIVVDISERVEAERIIQESSQYLQTLFNVVRAGILVIDTRNHTIIDVNPMAAELIGLPRKNIIGEDCHRFLCNSEAGNCTFQGNKSSSQSPHSSLTRADGKCVPIIKYVIPVILHERPCLLETFLDDTQRKEAEEALRESETRFRELAELFPQFIFEMDRTFRLTYFNWSAMDLTSYSYEEFEGGLDARTLISGMDLPFVESSVDRILKGERVPPIPFTLVRKDGSNLPVIMYAAPVVRENEYAGIRGIIVDISEQKKLENALTTANRKLNLMNQVTRHDILNTITGLLGLIDMTREKITDAQQSALIEESRDLVIKIKDQIVFTRDYQDVGVKAPQWQNLEATILNASGSIRLNDVTLIVSGASVEIFADPLFGRVFYNLMDNSLRHGGTVTEISVETEQAPSGDLIIQYRDNGVGVSPREKEKIFEQGVGKNTGFGLFIIREILGITGSTIRETGIYGKGILFEIQVPAGGFRWVKKK